jgi:hypothetical protein
MPGGKPGGLKPGGGPGMPGGAKGIGGRANDGAPTTNKWSARLYNCRVKKHELGGIIPMPRPAGMPRPGPTGSYRFISIKIDADHVQSRVPRSSCPRQR